MSAAERVDGWCEKGILALMLVTLVFGPLATGAVRPVEFLIVQGLVLMMVILWLVRIWVKPGYYLLCPPVTFMVVLFALYAVVRTIHADLPYVAHQELVRVLVYTLVFLIAVNNLHRQSHVQWISATLVLVGMFIACYAIYQFATESPRVWHFIKPPQYLGRGSGTYICPNHLAGFLEMLIPIGLAFAFLGRKKHILRLFLGYAAFVMTVGVIVSLSRGGWIATALSLLLLVVVLFQRRSHRIPILVVFLAICAGVYLFATRSELIQQRIESSVTSGTEGHIRSREWLAAPTVRMWLDHPWFGVGPGHFDHRFPAYRPPEIQARPGRAHNDYLNTLADWGAVGGLIILAALLLLAHSAWCTWRYVRREDDGLGVRQSNRSAFVLGSSVGLIALAIHSFTDFNMHIPANAILAVTLMALLSSHLRFTSNRYWIGLRWPARSFLTILLLVCGVYLARQGFLNGREHVALAQVAREPGLTSARIDALQHATTVAPLNFNTTYALGETYRQIAWQGLPGYQDYTRAAIQWYQRGIDLNPYDPYNHVRLGMCLDWLREHDLAAPFYHEAIRLDPNNHHLANLVGWHYFQVEDWHTAKQWFEQSLQIKWWANWIADRYLDIVNRQIAGSTAPPAPQVTDPIIQPDQ